MSRPLAAQPLDKPDLGGPQCRRASTVTLDRYGHLLPNLDAQVAEGLEATRRAALSENPAAHLLHEGRN